MGLGGDLAERELAWRGPPAQASTLHESERTRVTRLFSPGRTVIRKEPLGPDAQRRVQHEAAMLERLRGVRGCATGGCAAVSRGRS